MHSEVRAARMRRLLLGVLLAVAALAAFGGGLYGMSGADGFPVELLAGTPFIDYFIPGLILFVIVGGAFFAATVACFIGHEWSRQLTLIAVGVSWIWLAVQMAMIGHVSWMQPATAVYSLVLGALALSLPSSTPLRPPAGPSG
jgi:hypothetical protein